MKLRIKGKDVEFTLVGFDTDDSIESPMFGALVDGETFNGYLAHPYLSLGEALRLADFQDAAGLDPLTYDEHTGIFTWGCAEDDDPDLIETCEPVYLDADRTYSWPLYAIGASAWTWVPIFDDF